MNSASTGCSCFRPQSLLGRSTAFTLGSCQTCIITSRSLLSSLHGLSVCGLSRSRAAAVEVGAWPDDPRWCVMDPSSATANGGARQKVSTLRIRRGRQSLETLRSARTIGSVKRRNRKSKKLKFFSQKLNFFLKSGYRFPFPGKLGPSRTASASWPTWRGSWSGGWSSLVPFLLGTEQYLLSIHCGRLAMLNWVQVAGPKVAISGMSPKNYLPSCFSEHASVISRRRKSACECFERMAGTVI
jgi:hypothetical protein